MLTCSDSNVVLTEGTYLLPVSQQRGVHAVPVHVASERVSRAAVTVKGQSRCEVTSRCVAVVRLDGTGHKLERRALPEHISAALCEVGVV